MSISEKEFNFQKSEQLLQLIEEQAYSETNPEMIDEDLISILNSPFVIRHPSETTSKIQSNKKNDITKEQQKKDGLLECNYFMDYLDEIKDLTPINGNISHQIQSFFSIDKTNELTINPSNLE